MPKTRANPYYPKKPFPMLAVWELTYACNMRCRHCGSNAGGKLRARHRELTTKEALRVCDELAALGNQRITLSGGELFLRRDWDQIAARLRHHRIGVGLITNGFLLQQNLPKIQKLMPLEVVGISLDGTRATHDYLRRIPGSYDRVVAGFRALKKLGVRVAAISSISKRNLGELEAMHSLLVDLGVDGWQIQMIIGEGRMKASADLPGPEDIEKVARFIAAKQGASRMLVFAGDNIGYCMPGDELLRDGKPWRGCFAGLYVVGIEADGNVKGCLSLQPALMQDNPFVEGNVRTSSLEAIWNRRGAFAYNREFDEKKVEGFCRTCPHLTECRCGCTATAWALYGTRYENRYCMYRCAHARRR